MIALSLLEVPAASGATTVHSSPACGVNQFEKVPAEC